jgi:hypothetical protein
MGERTIQACLRYDHDRLAFLQSAYPLRHYASIQLREATTDELDSAIHDRVLVLSSSEIE